MKKNFKILLLLVAGFALVGADVETRASNCQKDFDEERPVNPPIIFREDNIRILYPKQLQSGEKVLEFSHGVKYLSVCTKSPIEATGKKLSTLECKDGELRIDGKVVHSMKKVNCTTRDPKSEIVATYEACSRGGYIYNIGFTVEKNHFITLIKLCFNLATGTASYSHHNIHGHITDLQYDNPPHTVLQPHGVSYLVTSIKKAYDQRHQHKAMKHLLGHERGEEIIPKIDGDRLVSGYLSPYFDFLYEYQQLAAFYFANTLPIWKSIDDGNWQSMGAKIRELAEEEGRWLQVWTGSTEEILKLADENNNDVEIHLSKGPGELPVSALLWKVVYDADANRAAALVLYNNPFATALPDNLNLCPDICDQIPWVTWDRANFAKGFTYCCTVESLRAHISDVPDLGTVDLLV